MKVLTLTQPYASLVALRAKSIETRSWHTLFRGPIAIHAGKGLGPVGGRQGLHSLCADPPFFAALQPDMMRVCESFDGEAWPEFDADLLPRGAIVAVATLAGCEPTDGADALYGGGWHMVGDVEGRWTLSDQERAFGDYSAGRYAWLLSDVRPLKTPLPYAGAQGLRTLPADVVAQVEGLL